MSTSYNPSSSGRRPRIGYLVDVQNDFMLPTLPGGRLYVKHLTDPADPGAQAIITRLGSLSRWMSAECDALVLSGDWHSYVDAEIAREGADYKTTYPPHCMGLSPDAAERLGAALIPEVRPEAPLARLERDATRWRAQVVAQQAVGSRTPVFVEKRDFSVWTGNPAMGHFAKELVNAFGSVPEVIIAGVASDVCVDQAIGGFLARGFPVSVVQDAIYSLGTQPDAELLASWATRGATLTSLAELQARPPRIQPAAPAPVRSRAGR
jgi:nicotinamidase-related amidase